MWIVPTLGYLDPQGTVGRPPRKRKSGDSSDWGKESSRTLIPHCSGGSTKRKYQCAVYLRPMILQLQ